MNKKSILIFMTVLILLTVLGIAYRVITKEPEAEKYDHLHTLLPGMEISALFDDGENIWAGTGDGIYLLDRDTGDTVRKLDADIHMIYSAMITRSYDGLVWVGHEDGLSAFDSSFKEVMRITAPAIPEGRVNTLLAADDGLWAGSQNGAAHLCIKDDAWTVDEILTKDTGLAEDVVQVIEKVGDELWFGAYLSQDKGGISILSENGWSYLNTDDGIPHSYINAILPLSDDEVLIGSGQMMYGGLSIAGKQEGKWKISSNLDQNDGIPGMKVRTLFLDSAGRLFITTETDGLILLNSPDELNATPLNGTVIKQENGLADNEIKCIIECESCYFLGGKYGLTRWDKQIIKKDMIHTLKQM